jgi:hypothetical protein
MDNHENLTFQQAPPAGQPGLSAVPNSTGQAFGAQRIPGSSGHRPAERAPGHEPALSDEAAAAEQASAAEQALALAAEIARELAFLDGIAAADCDTGDPAAFVTTAER